MFYKSFQLRIFHLRQETQINIELWNGLFIYRQLSHKLAGLFIVEQIISMCKIMSKDFIGLIMNLMLVDEFGIQNYESFVVRNCDRLLLCIWHFPQYNFLKLTLRRSTYSLKWDIFA